MSDGLDVRPVLTGTAEYRKASSSCCSAPLDLGGSESEPGYACRACGQPCERVLGEPVKVELHG